MTTHEVLVAARNYLEREGWAQGHWPDFGEWIYPPDSPNATCASNVLKRLECDEPERWKARRELLKAIGRDDVADIFRWNDTPGRTKAEVLAAFDKAIAATAPDPLKGVILDTESVLA